MTMQSRDSQPQRSTKKPFNPGISLAGAVDLSAVKHTVDAAPGQKGGAPAAGKYVIDITEASFQAVVQTSASYPVLLFLWVPTDDRLFDLARTLGDAVNAQNGKIQMARVDIDQYPSIAQALQVQGAPALFALISGRPMPIFQGLPSQEELSQIVDTLIPQVIAVAEQSGITGTAPLNDSDEDASGDQAKNTDDGDEHADGNEDQQIPAEHQHAHDLALNGDFAQAAREYEKIIETNPTDSLARREFAKARLLDRAGHADVNAVRKAAADKPDDCDAQLQVADIDMLGGQVDDAFGRLLDFAAVPAHRNNLDTIRQRLVEYFPILDDDDPRLKRARMRIATLLY